MSTNVPPPDTLPNTSVLDVFPPQSPQIDLNKIIQESGFNNLREVPHRRHVFFDEHVNLAVVLKTSLDERAVREILLTAHLNIAGHATDAVPQGSGKAATASGKYDLTSNVLSGKNPQDVFACEDHTFVVWRTQLQVIRPRVRLQRPAIYFTAALAWDHSVIKREQPTKYLQSYEHLSSNVLEPLQQDAFFFDTLLSLPESMLIKVTPASAAPKESLRPIRGASNRAYPAVPALFTRARCSIVSDQLFLSVHVEASPLVARSIEVQQIQLNLTGAIIQDLDPHTVPETIKSGDELVRLFRVLPPGTFESQRDIKIVVTARVFSRDDSDVVVRSAWQTQVFPPHLRSRSTFKWSRPLSGTLIHGRIPIPRLPPIDDGEELTQSQGKDAPGITFTFTSPTVVRRGNDVNLLVQCINMSNRIRRFILVPFAPKPLKDVHHGSSSITSIGSNASGLHGEQVSHRSQAPITLSMSSEVKIGPVSVGASDETILKYRAMKSGPIVIGMVRIFDLDTRQTVDVKELPSVIATDT